MNINIKEMYRSLKNPLYLNSIYIGSSRIINVFFGFLFWFIAAKYYSIDEVGIATVLISSLNILIIISRFGFEFSIIRFLPLHDKNKVFSTCFNIIMLSSFLVTIFFIFGIDVFSPNISFIRDHAYGPAFILFVLFNSTTLFFGRTFMALRKSKYLFYQNIILILRVILLPIFVSLKGFGVFVAMGITNFIAMVYSSFNLKSDISYRKEFDMAFIRKSFNFSAGNYVSNILTQLPILILPIIISNRLGSEDAARYYIAFAIANILFIIPDALGNSFFVEGSYGINLRKALKKSMIVSYAILIPAVLFIILFGEYVLRLFGQAYVGSYDLLLVYSLSSFFVVNHLLSIPLFNIKMKVYNNIRINLIRALLLLSMMYVLIQDYGILGIGYSWFLTYFMINIIIFIIFIKEGWVSRRQVVA